jgi:hypothetical protein
VPQPLFEDCEDVNMMHMTRSDTVAGSVMSERDSFPVLVVNTFDADKDGFRRWSSSVLLRQRQKRKTRRKWRRLHSSISEILENGKFHIFHVQLKRYLPNVPEFAYQYFAAYKILRMKTKYSNSPPIWKLEVMFYAGVRGKYRNSDASKEVGPEVNADKTKYMLLSV